MKLVENVLSLISILIGKLRITALPRKKNTTAVLNVTFSLYFSKQKKPYVQFFYHCINGEDGFSARRTVMIDKVISFCLISAAVLFLGAASACRAQQEGDPVIIGTYRIIHSDILNEDRTLLIHLPDGYEESTDSYPVFYMLYGNHMNTYFTECVSVLSQYASSGRIPPMILVAVSNTDRYRDLIPFDREGNKTGIDNFIAFFRDECIPSIEARYRTKEYRVLLGPQAGANFALYIMFTAPYLFDAFIINNPFRWASGRDLFLEKAEVYFKDHDLFDKFLFITNDASDGLEREGNIYIGKLEAIVEKYQPQGFTLQLNYLPENDDFISPLGVRDGLKALFSSYQMPEDAPVNSLADIISYYRDLSDRLGFDIDIPGHVLSRQSDRLMQANRQKEAVEIYHYMIDHDAHAPDAYWRLADLAIRNGNYQAAKEYLGNMLKIFHGDVGMIKQRFDWVVRKLDDLEEK